MNTMKPCQSDVFIRVRIHTRAQHPCVDRAHIYRHPKKVDSGAMYVYADGGCVGKYSVIGFSVDGEKWKEALISTFVGGGSWSSVLVVDEAVWRQQLGLNSWQYMYYAQVLDAHAAAYAHTRPAATRTHTTRAAAA